MNPIIWGECFTRYDKSAGAREIVGLAGNRISINNMPAQYKREKCCDNFTGENCLILKRSSWMNPWAIVEGINIPNRPGNKILVSIYHHLGKYFCMNNELKIEIADIPYDAETKPQFHIISR